MAISDNHTLASLALAETWRRVKRGLRAVGGAFGIVGAPPNRILLAPTDLRTTDPTRAHDFYEGIFSFAGRMVETSGANVFDMPPPTNSWEDELHSFRWFRHLSVSSSLVAQANARRLLNDWISRNKSPSSNAVWKPEIVSRRLISWLMHSQFILQDAEPVFYKTFMRSVWEHVHLLKRSSSHGDVDLPSLNGAITLTYCRYCISAQKNNLKGASRMLERQLSKQILEDGVHINRNPAIILELIADLIPLQQVIIRQGAQVPVELVSAIDRMMQALRFFAMSNGDLARFNGASVTKHDLLATVLRYNNALGKPHSDAVQSGFQRMSQGVATLIMDTGRPSLGFTSIDAHAGTLSFELTSGKRNIIVNCGAPFVWNGEKRVWRTSEAHSTAILNKTSSSRIQANGGLNKYLGEQIISGPQKVTMDRRETKSESTIIASHDGYLKSLGVVHSRAIKMTNAGETIFGNDRFLDRNGEPTKFQSRDDFEIRFHLHPTIEAVPSEKPGFVVLTRNTTPVWQFGCLDIPIVIEDDVFYAASMGHQVSQQIVLRGSFTDNHDIRWMLQKVN